MIKLSPSNKVEMIAAFLKMEFFSERYTATILDALKQLNLHDDVILNGDLSNESMNAKRNDILGQYRGYGHNLGLFEHFSADIQWVWTRFGRKDLTHIRYINYSYWNELSNGTGSPLDAAKTIHSGKTVFHVPNDGFWQALKWLSSGQTFPTLIMVTDPDEDVFTILEYHKRMTAYGMALERFMDVSVLLGICTKDEQNNWFGAMPIIG